MERFVHAQNLARYVDLFEAESDPAQRERLHALLIEEENRFGTWRERVQEADSLIAKAQTKVLNQQRLVAQLKGDGHDSALADSVLDNMTALFEILLAYRDNLHRIEDGPHPS